MFKKHYMYIYIYTVNHLGAQHFTRTPFRQGTTGPHSPQLVESHAMEPVFEIRYRAANALAGSWWSAVQTTVWRSEKIDEDTSYGKEPSPCHFHRTFGWARHDSITPRDALSPTAYAVPRFVIELMSGVALRYVTQAIAVPDDGLFKALDDHAQEWQKMRLCFWIYVKSELSYFNYAIQRVTAPKKPQLTN